MSKSIKGAKGPGHEYWSRRPQGGGNGTPGAYNKSLTHKAERHQSQTEIQTGLDEIGYPDEEPARLGWDE
ncbi:hypothetical protein [Methylovorus mays]|uniref:hypothetical protein n=1 Tax=Methylovorus mays TaxID=184077 RepID=UPI001E477596|nr:hypothetical protein [Methylovorus mays]MCB5206097.1 hypothetical protein [Methylovorus mays]